MCGVTGIFNTDGNPVSVATLRAMTDAVAHRGPDGEGFYTDSFIGLGHRRLSIVDLSSAGHQPMVSPDGQVAVVYNGMVYNFREIRTELEARGYGFRSQTDSEVVLNAYREWGPACLDRFNGMFALAIWDRRHQRLFLARDRYGIKPLYYVRLGSTLLVASEIKAFLKHPSFNARVSKRHLLEYLTFQNIFTDGTLFEGVQLLPPGHWASVSLGSPEVHRQMYWDFEFAEPAEPASEREYEEELDRLFCQAVRRQLVADVPVGAYLSGGMDSGSITAVAAQEIPFLSSFTGGFDLTSASGLELGFDERQMAEAMSYRFRTEHYEVVLKAGDMERCMPALTWHLEDPRVGQCYPNYYVARLASKFVKVVLSGAGGDELFAGYPWRYYRAVVNGSFDDYIEKYFRFWHRLLPSDELATLFREDVWREVREIDTVDLFRSVLERHHCVPSTPEEYVNQSLYFEAKTFLHGLLLVEDKLSMAHGLEGRVPFLDNDLVDFAQRVPVNLKLRNLGEVVRLNENEPGAKDLRYFERTHDGKLILREVMRRHVPELLTDQVKQGFSGPDASWFKGESIDYVRRELLDGDGPLFELLDRREVRRLVSDHIEGRENRRLLIWSLLSVNEWCRAFLC